MTGLVDIAKKPVVGRTCVSEGRILLSPASIDAIRRRKLDKGDALEAAQVAALLAIKQTPMLLPHCHPIPLQGVTVNFQVEDSGVWARVQVRAQAQTGVEMEALVGVQVALLTIWDMTKPLEKDAKGQYPGTRIQDVRVVSKEKA